MSHVLSTDSHKKAGVCLGRAVILQWCRSAAANGQGLSCRELIHGRGWVDCRTVVGTVHSVDADALASRTLALTLTDLLPAVKRTASALTTLKQHHAMADVA